MDQVIIVSGAAGNLGKAIVNRMAREKVRVVAVVSPRSAGYIHESDFVETVSLDAMDAGAVKECVASVVKKHGLLTGLVHTIGGFVAGTLAETGISDLERMIRLNFYSTFAFAKPSIEFMRKQDGGHLVFIGSRSAIRPAEGKKGLAYALSKSLLFNFASCINADLPESRVAASILVPGTIDTPENRKSLPKADTSHWVSTGALADMAWTLVSRNHAAWREPVVKLYGDS